MVSRLDRGPVGNWWWTIDRWYLAAFLSLMLLGIAIRRGGNHRSNLPVGTHFAVWNLPHDKADGFKKIIMHARKSAAGFYEKLGYQVCSGEFEEVTLPHYEMEKKLV